MWKNIAKAVLTSYLWIGGIGVFILACIVGKSGSNYFGEPEFNFTAFIIVLIIGGIVLFLSAMMFGLIVEAMEHLEQIEYNTAKAARNVRENTPPINIKGKDSKLNLSAVAHSTDDCWICKKCGEKNKNVNRYCFTCGSDK